MGEVDAGGAGRGGGRLRKNMDFQTATSEIQRISAVSHVEKSEEVEAGSENTVTGKSS